jgi:hypothetical protein
MRFLRGQEGDKASSYISISITSEENGFLFPEAVVLISCLGDLSDGFKQLIS